MRHESISKAQISAAAWPTTMDGLVLAEPHEAAEAAPGSDTPMPAAAAPDVAAGVGVVIVGAYVALILVFFAFFAGSLLSAFVITIAAGFVGIFFAIPRIFFGLELDKSRRPSFSAFMHQGMETLTGHSSGGSALVQMVIVPVLLTLGLLAMGIAGKIYL